ncbi:MAG TPA: hypothetical protein DCR35_04105 [Runella sp.]|nr:hypothetical protein [Runella sp.]HAO48539.1 hypothetical protein [Runella sp.]
MKQSSNTLVWGSILLAFGLVLLAKTLGWFHIDWGFTLRFWPVLLILAGGVLLLKQSWSGVVTAILIALAIPSAIINGANKKFHDWDDRGFEFNIDDFDDDDDDHHNHRNDYEERSDTYSKDGKTHFSEPFTENIADATLKFGAGAGEFTIEGTTSQLVEADAETEFGNYIMTAKRNESTKTSVVDFEMESKDSTGRKKIRIRDFDNMDNRVEMRLSDKPTWTFDLGLGAGKGNFDLSAYRVKKVKLGAGAAEVDLKLGENVENDAQIDIEAGVASIEINIPESVGCEFKIDGALNSKDLDNFEKISSGLYRTSNYNSAKKKIKISYEGGISSLEVNRY